MTNINETDEQMFSRSGHGHGICMESVSDELAVLSRKNFSAILRSLGELGQVHVADKLVVHEATISRMKNPGGELERIAVVLAALGIDLPANNQRVYSVEVVEALRVLALSNLAALAASTQ